MIVTVREGHLPGQHAQPQPAASPQLASASAAGSNSQDPKSGFVDVVMPCEPSAAAAATSSGPSDFQGPRGAVEDARQDAAEPEATLPGGTATRGGSARRGRAAGTNKSHITCDAKQRQLDWSAAAGSKRKTAGGLPSACDVLDTQQQLTKPLAKRQSKLKLSFSKT